MHTEPRWLGGGSQWRGGPRRRLLLLCIGALLRPLPPWSLLDAALWLLAFGVLLEVAQLLFVAGRSGELLDLAIDSAGIGLGCAVYAWLMNFKVAVS